MDKRVSLAKAAQLVQPGNTLGLGGILLYRRPVGRNPGGRPGVGTGIRVFETEPPTAEELDLLRRVMDPLGTRRLETGSGAARRALLREILARETGPV